MTRYKVIANPVAGKGAGERAIPQIQRRLTEYGLDFDIVRTEQPWHAAELAQEAVASGYDVVVAAGGDGTANEVLNGLMKAKLAGSNVCAMSILCVGRGNDFAFGAGVPTDFEAGCQALAQGYRRTMDVGWVVGGLYPEGRYFGNGIGIGFDALVGFEAARFKKLGGFLGYIVAVLKTILFNYYAPVVAIEAGGQTITQASLMISIMNGRRMGGGFMMTPESSPDDGQLDLCIAGKVGRIEMLKLVPRFIKGTQATHYAIKMGRSPRVVVTAVEGVLPAHADGETLCTSGERLELEVLPRQIEILCQPPEVAQ